MFPLALNLTCLSRLSIRCISGLTSDFLVGLVSSHSCHAQQPKTCSCLHVMSFHQGVSCYSFHQYQRIIFHMLVFTSSQSGYVKCYFFGVNDFTHEEGLTSKGFCRSFSVDGRNFQATLCLGWEQLKTSRFALPLGLNQQIMRQT